MCVLPGPQMVPIALLNRCLENMQAYCNAYISPIDRDLHIVCSGTIIRMLLTRSMLEGIIKLTQNNEKGRKTIPVTN